MKETIGYLLVLALLIAATISWEVYKYDDCRKVGHGLLYCVFAK